MCWLEAWGIGVAVGKKRGQLQGYSEKMLVRNEWRLWWGMGGCEVAVRGCWWGMGVGNGVRPQGEARYDEVTGPSLRSEASWGCGVKASRSEASWSCGFWLQGCLRGCGRTLSVVVYSMHILDFNQCRDEYIKSVMNIGDYIPSTIARILNTLMCGWDVPIFVAAGQPCHRKPSPEITWSGDFSATRIVSPSLIINKLRFHYKLKVWTFSRPL